MSTPILGSILLGSADAARLRAWFERALGVAPNVDGFLELGPVAVLVDQRDDVAARNPEPGRVIVNLHVGDARAVADRLTALDVRWVAPLEYREGAGAWFATFEDPDGNYVQLVELTEAYHAARAEREAAR